MLQMAQSTLGFQGLCSEIKGVLGALTAVICGGSEPQYLYLDAACKVCSNFSMHSLLCDPSVEVRGLSPYLMGKNTGGVFLKSHGDMGGIGSPVLAL